MKEYLPLISSAGLVLGGLMWLGWAVISGFRKRQQNTNQRLDKAQTELNTVMRLEAEAWKTRYEGEHEEYAQYRQKTHDFNNEANSRILKLTAENAELRGKTDLTPVLRFHQEQSSINAKVVQGLDLILVKLSTSKPHFEGSASGGTNK